VLRTKSPLSLLSFANDIEQLHTRINRVKRGIYGRFVFTIKHSADASGYQGLNCSAFLCVVATKSALGIGHKNRLHTSFAGTAC
jgi:hypothetical protein